MTDLLNRIKIVDLPEGIRCAELSDIATTSEVAALLQFAKDNNIKYYVAKTHAGKGYHMPNGVVTLLPESQLYGENPDYVLPVEVSEKALEVVEEVGEEKNPEIVEEVTEEPDIDDAEMTVQAPVADVESVVLAKVDISAGRVKELEVELEEAKAYCNSLDNEVKMLRQKPITLDQVVEYVLEHGYQLIIN